MRAVAAGRLSVSPDPVARERQHEGREPERPERGRVHEEPCEEASDGADDTAPEQRERDERDEEDVGDGPEYMELRENRNLGDRRHEEQGGGLRAVDERHRRGFFGINTATASSEPRFA